MGKVFLAHRKKQKFKNARKASGPLNNFLRKGKDPDPYFCLRDTDADPGGPNTYGSNGSGTLSFITLD